MRLDTKKLYSPFSIYFRCKITCYQLSTPIYLEIIQIYVYVTSFQTRFSQKFSSNLQRNSYFLSSSPSYLRHYFLALYTIHELRSTLYRYIRVCARVLHAEGRLTSLRDNARDVYQAAAVIGVSSSANITVVLTLAIASCLIKLSLPPTCLN